MKKRKVVILGSTGSIGRSSLDVIRRLRNSFQVVGLGANQNLKQISEQIKDFSPRVVSLDDTPTALKLKSLLSKRNKQTTVWNHSHGLEKLARMKEADFVMCGVVGARGLLPLVSALKAGKTIGLANKEALIVAGDIIMNLSKKYNAPVIPVDSEHSAIFQCLKGHSHGEVSKLILTASGGPFYRTSKNLDQITVGEALNHPTWKMGKKITIDSATLMNKGLEAIEAHHLFQVPMEKISIVIHPQSIVHSLVEFEDGAILAQLSHPDMRLPIQYALTYPKRYSTPIKRLKLEEIGQLDFAEPNFSKFPCLKLALEAGQRGGTAPVALSSSNEMAVKAFIEDRISFMTIPKVVRHVLKSHAFKNRPTLNQILDVDNWSRQEAERRIKKWERK